MRGSLPHLHGVEPDSLTLVLPLITFAAYTKLMGLSVVDMAMQIAVSAPICCCYTHMNNGGGILTGAPGGPISPVSPF